MISPDKYILLLHLWLLHSHAQKVFHKLALVVYTDSSALSSTRHICNTRIQQTTKVLKHVDCYCYTHSYGRAWGEGRQKNYKNVVKHTACLHVSPCLCSQLLSLSVFESDVEKYLVELSFIIHPYRHRMVVGYRRRRRRRLLAGTIWQWLVALHLLIPSSASCTH